LTKALSHEPHHQDMKRLGILASHRGTNFQAIIDACQSGKVNATPVLAISNNSKSEALARANRSGIATLHLSSQTHCSSTAIDSAMLDALQAHEVDLVITAGYMKKLGPKTLKAYERKIINVHPSLLPKHGGKGMFGMKVHESVIQSGDLQTGITIHWVDKEYDTGPIIAQQVVAVEPNDTALSLAKKVLTHEHNLLIETLATLMPDWSDI